ncbi:methylated-DNA--[protein]-cysteine S-methyltransferase [Desulfocurvibacter africanus]|uniref:methylated-DNA--[protein]-cysteine S-methyltransferase n=1 Tax=Desulfocurvibacter africanus TaxID=873 RepID=UPI000429A639|nr:methylated-DNA--[protein]-cysteine S-methyltransferase [Desulfocurvibacter africanus]
MSFEVIISKPLCLSLHWESDSIAAIGLDWAGPDAPSGPEPTSRYGRALAQTLTRYLAGERVEWPELPLAMDGLTPFRREVSETLAKDVRHGQLTTYGQLASLVGRPGAARAVGRVMATNPWPLVVPCHRVIGTGGNLTGFGPGIAMKKFLLDLEQTSQSG